MSCELHKLHRPRNLTTEFHHVIPQAWQAAWSPPSVLPRRRLVEVGKSLWAPETVELCPTSHRNVHYWIVKMMHALRDADSDDPLVAKVGIGTLGREQLLAYDALTGFRMHGGSLKALYLAGEWGQA